MSSSFFVLDQESLEISFSQDSSEKKDEQKECLICVDKPPNIVLHPCGHGGMCKTCIVKMFLGKLDDEQSEEVKVECPLCRKNFDRAFVIKKDDIGKFQIAQALELARK